MRAARSGAPSLLFAALTLKCLLQSDPELVADFASIGSSASIAQQFFQLLRCVRARLGTPLHRGMRAAELHTCSADEKEVDERPRIVRAAYAAGTKAYRHPSDIA